MKATVKTDRSKRRMIGWRCPLAVLRVQDGLKPASLFLDAFACCCEGVDPLEPARSIGTALDKMILPRPSSERAGILQSSKDQAAAVLPPALPASDLVIR